MSAPFPPDVKNIMRKMFNWTCTICLNALPDEGSECTHIFDSSKAGEAQLEDTMDPEAVWEVFTELEHRCPPTLRRFTELYSLIPLFPESDQRSKPYELHCNMPPTCIVNGKGKFETISSPESTVQRQLYRIFSYKNAWRLTTPGILRFTPEPLHHEATTDYWHIPVKCHIILYLFIQRTVKRKSSSPEVALAGQIYATLLKRRGILTASLRTKSLHLPAIHHSCKVFV
ncbi:hypothetical protein B0H17DRAFT_1130679 [Mycena rosella]|uniref:Uncharacterized protein n=1 Tax=Mycena rosella TaxID=1033263 RepID=A0AAD7DQV2_MYCRO|nr:hypothetical protein B0H17DRAFT_1130679 [Mycena rosella]